MAGFNSPGDNNSRKPLCRLWFNGTQKYLGLFDEAKAETRHPISGVNEIFQFAEQLKRTATQYDAGGGAKEPGTAGDVVA